MSDDFDDESGDDDATGGGPFEENTSGVLIAGRTADSAGLTRAGMVALLESVEALGKEKGVALTLVPAGDFTETGPGPEDTCYVTMAIGLNVRTGGGYGPESVPTDAITAKLNAAKAIGDDVWREVAALLPERERQGFLEQEVGLDLLCVGPLAAAYFVFGEEGSEEDGGDGEYHHGQDMSQEPHDNGVWGLEVAGCEFEGTDHARVDFSEAAHQSRLSAHPSGQYHLIARYD